MQFRLVSPAVLLGLSPAAIAAALVLSICCGAKTIALDAVRDAFFHFDPGNVNHQIVLHSRLPRAVGALLIGAFLAVSGALMQGMTRNYLASPSIMGVADGSVFVITLCMVFRPESTGLDMIGASLIGSLIGVSIVFGLARLMPNGLSPVKLAILGTIIGTFLSGAAAALAAYFQVSQNISFWYNARLHQIDPALLRLAIPFAVVGLALALALSKSVTVLSLGEEVAVGLGNRAQLVKALTLTAVVLLTGISVALVGNIGFVGLIVPHMTRYVIGSADYRWIVPCAGVLGGLFLALADVASRFLNAPFETPIGVVTALVGVPFFLYLIRKRGGGERA